MARALNWFCVISISYASTIVFKMVVLRRQFSLSYSKITFLYLTHVSAFFFLTCNLFPLHLTIAFWGMAFPDEVCFKTFWFPTSIIVVHFIKGQKNLVSYTCTTEQISNELIFLNFFNYDNTLLYMSWVFSTQCTLARY